MEKSKSSKILKVQFNLSLSLSEKDLLQNFNRNDLLKEHFLEHKVRKSFQKIVHQDFGSDTFTSLFRQKNLEFVRDNLHFTGKRCFRIFSEQFVKDRKVEEANPLQVQKESEERGQMLHTSEIEELNNFLGAKRVSQMVQSFGGHAELCAEKLHHLELLTSSKSLAVTIAEELLNSVLTARSEKQLLVYVKLAAELGSNEHFLDVLKDSVGEMNRLLFEAPTPSEWRELRNVGNFFAQVQSMTGVAFEFYPKKLFSEEEPVGHAGQLDQKGEGFEDIFKLTGNIGENEQSWLASDSSCEEQFLFEYLYQISLMLEDPQVIMANVSKSELLEYFPLNKKFTTQKKYLEENNGRKLQFGFVEDFISARDQKKNFQDWASENEDLHDESAELFHMFVHAFLGRATKSLSHIKTYSNRHKASLKEYFGFDADQKSSFYSGFLEAQVREPLLPFQRLVEEEKNGENKIVEEGGQDAGATNGKEVKTIEIQEKMVRSRVDFSPVYKKKHLDKMNQFLAILFKGSANSPMSIFLCCKTLSKKDIFPMDVLVKRVFECLFDQERVYRSVFLDILKEIKSEILFNISRKEKALKKKLREIKKSKKSEKKGEKKESSKHNKLVKFSVMQAKGLLESPNPLLGLSFEQILGQFKLGVFELLFFNRVLWMSLVFFVKKHRVQLKGTFVFGGFSLIPRKNEVRRVQASACTVAFAKFVPLEAGFGRRSRSRRLSFFLGEGR